MDRYRIRWGRVLVSRRYGAPSRIELMCIAERRISILGFISFWWPTENGGWRFDENGARKDIRDGVELRKPLPGNVYIRTETSTEQAND